MPASAGQTYSYTGSAQFFTVTTSGNYDISAFGGKGGDAPHATGGLGGEETGRFALTAGEHLKIVVGGNGGNGFMAAGGGGTFVFADIGAGGAYVPLIIGGGGGGAEYSVAGLAGGSDPGNSNNGLGGAFVAGGGGAGLKSAGGGGYYKGVVPPGGGPRTGQTVSGTTGGGSTGPSYAGGAGWSGDDGRGARGLGTFGGGGGGGFNGGGGGGGYTGGNGGNNYSPGFGGASFVGSSGTVFIARTHDGYSSNGQVVISSSSPSSTPATPAAPTLANDTGTPGDNITSDPTINYPTPAAGDALLYSTDGMIYGTAAPTFATGGSQDGTYTVSIEEQNASGGTSAPSSLTFTLDTPVRSFGYSGSVQFFTVVKSGIYDITAYGGQGGRGSGGAGGYGAKETGEFMLTAGEKLQFIVGGYAGGSYNGGGGGGGSFVLANVGPNGAYVPLVVAGGGGGGGRYMYGGSQTGGGDASADFSARAGASGYVNAIGGSGAYGGGGGGAGFSSSGGSGSGSESGQGGSSAPSFAAGSSYAGTFGAFGGGGGSGEYGGGGGGGYAGGAGRNNYAGGQGGTSFVNTSRGGTVVAAETANGAGQYAGKVILNRVSSATNAATVPTITGVTAGTDSGTQGDNRTDIAKPAIFGTGNANATITVYLDGSTAALGTTTSDGTGTFTYMFASPLSTGSHSITATDTVGGSTSSASSAYSFTIDPVPPLPSTPALAPGQDTGASASDGITNINTPAVTGTAQAGLTVALFADNGAQIGASVTNGSGAYTITPTVALSDGRHLLYATSTDAYGNRGSGTSGVLYVTIQTAMPAASAPTLAAGQDTGVSSSDGITSVKTPTVTGTATAGSTVRLYDTNGTTLLGTATANSNGAYSIKSSTLGDGSHTLTVISTDLAGNVGARSSGTAVAIDTSAPVNPTIAVAAASDTGASSTDGITKNPTPTLTGNAEAGSTVTLYRDNAVLIGTTTAAMNGNYSITSTALTEGRHQLYTTVMDVAGNRGAAPAITYATIDMTTPVATIAGDGTTVTVAKQTITGTGEAGSTILLSDNNVSLGSVFVNSNGMWAKAVTLSTGQNMFTATDTDLAGNVGTAQASTITYRPTGSAMSAAAQGLRQHDADGGDDVGAHRRRRSCRRSPT